MRHEVISISNDDRSVGEPVRLLALGFKRIAGMKGCGPFLWEGRSGAERNGDIGHVEIYDATISPRGDARS
jgi:hypothetical protein